jgi:putative hemolysin
MGSKDVIYNTRGMVLCIVFSTPCVIANEAKQPEFGVANPEFYCELP